MAKSARASTRKRNNANLRTKVFGPAFDARTERLSAKLQEIANTPKPEEDKQMEVDGVKQADAENIRNTKAQGWSPVLLQSCSNERSNNCTDEAMQWTGLTTKSRKFKTSKSSGRVLKIAKRKPRNQMVFPSEAARKKRQAKGKK